jgi:hypothetical protein
MTLFFTILGSLVLLGLFLFLVSLGWAWLERYRFSRLSIGEKLEEYQKIMEGKKP